MDRLLQFLKRHCGWVLNQRGGGSDDKVTEVTPKPVETPNYGKIFRDVLGEYRNYFPQQLDLGEQQAGYISQALQNPNLMTPEQQAAIEAIRGRETQRLQEALRTRANLGGGLYGGRAAGTEERSVSELGQAFAQQDYLNRINREQSLLGLAQSGQVSPTSIGQLAQTPYGGELQSALANQPTYYYQQGQASPAWALGGAALGGLLGGPVGASIGGSLLDYFGKKK